MIISKIQGGLGNQMFQYAFGLSQATRLNSELKIEIDNFDSPEEYRNFELNLFNISAKKVEQEDLDSLGVPSLSSKKIIPKIRRGLLKKHELNLPIEEKTIVIENGFAFDSTTSKITDGTILVGNWQSEKYFKQIRDRIVKEFSIKNPSAIFKKFQEVIIKNLDLSISVHVRRGDYANNPKYNAKHGVLPIEYYSKSVELIREKIPNAIFYIFSDDIPWVKENLSFIKPVIFVSDNGTNNAEDIILMSLCRYHIIANSSFSWWGAWLDQKKDKTVIAPKQWFVASNDTTDDLIPKEWLRI